MADISRRQSEWRQQPVTVTLPRHWWLLVSTCLRVCIRTDALRSERAVLPEIDRVLSEQSGYGEAA